MRVNEIVCRVRGDWQAGRKFRNRGLSLAPTAATHLYPRELVEYQAGDIGQGYDYLEQLVNALPLNPAGPILFWSELSATIGVAAYINGFNDHLDISVAAAEAVISSPFCQPYA